jgi:hypothetical protein
MELQLKFESTYKFASTTIVESSKSIPIKLADSLADDDIVTVNKTITSVGDSPLRDRFPHLFSISLQKEVSVADVRSPNSDLERWRLVWRWVLFEWEKALLL